MDDGDRIQYSRWIEKYRVKYKVEILAYCLMNNHVHFIACPKKKDSFARMFNTVHMLYAQYFNKRYGLSGHLWQGRYYSCILGESHLAAALRYTERNPVRARIVKKPWAWIWSSAREHIGKKWGQIQLADINNFIEIDDWKDYIEGEDRETDLKNIRQTTKSGRIFGSKQFCEKLEKSLGLNLQKPKMGRPMKK
jgi:putative transposase